MRWIEVACYNMECPVLKLFLLMILNILTGWPLPKRVAWYDNDRVTQMGWPVLF